MPMGTKTILRIAAGGLFSVTIFLSVNVFNKIRKIFSNVKCNVAKGNKVWYFHNIAEYIIAIKNWEIPQMANMKIIESEASFGNLFNGIVAIDCAPPSRLKIWTKLKNKLIFDFFSKKKQCVSSHYFST